MKSNTAQLARSIDALSYVGVDGTPPTALRLFAAGAVETTKGTFQFTAASAKAVIASATDYGNDLMFDYDHASVGFLAADPAEAGKAAGWFKPEVRNGELWAADIRWTPTASKKLMDREYRYVSPTFCHTDSGEIMELINAALTNMPATKRMAPIMASRKDNTMDLTQLTTALGVAETATVEEMTAVVTALTSARNQVATLSAEIETLKTEKRQAEIVAMVEAGQRDGKIPPALSDWAKTQSVESLRAFLAAAPAIKTVSATPPPADKTVAAPTLSLTEQEKKFARAAGVTDEAMLARKVALADRKAAAIDSEDD